MVLVLLLLSFLSASEKLYCENSKLFLEGSTAKTCFHFNPLPIGSGTFTGSEINTTSKHSYGIKIYR